MNVLPHHSFLVSVYAIPGIKSRNESRTHDVSFVVASVCDYYGISLVDISGRSRRQPIARARQVAMYILRCGGMFLKEIGKLFGRDHSTVLYATQTVPDLIETDPSMATDIRKLKALIGI